MDVKEIRLEPSVSRPRLCGGGGQERRGQSSVPACAGQSFLDSWIRATTWLWTHCGLTATAMLLDR